MADDLGDELDVKFLGDGRIIDWIERELAKAQVGDHGLVSVSDAYRIAFTACEKTLRAVGGL